MNPMSLSMNVMPGLFSSEEEFLEERRRGLARFLEIVARHPVMSEDEDVRQFYSEVDEVPLVRVRRSRVRRGAADSCRDAPGHCHAGDAPAHSAGGARQLPQGATCLGHCGGVHV